MPPPDHIPVARFEIVELDIDQMADGPDGLARIGGYVILVPGTLPGERVKVQMTSAARKFGRGELLEVLRPSPDRVVPRCRHFLDCGGCHMQHASYEAQLHSKQQRLQRALQHALGDDAPPVAACVAPGEPWGQRHKIALHLRQWGDELQPCFHRVRSIDLVEVLECPASDEDGLELAFAAVDELSRLRLPVFVPEEGGVLRSVLVRQSAGTGESHVLLVATEAPKGIDEVAGRIHERGATTVSLNLNPGPPDHLLGRATRVLVGPPRIEERIGGMRLAISPDSFFQTSPGGAERLVELVLQGLQPGPGDVTADLYCGGGLFSLPLAQASKQVVGVEQDHSAVLDARTSAQWNHIDNVEFVHAGVATQLRRWQQGTKLDRVVLDPPRQGCEAEVVELLCKLGPRRVAYVSCDVEALGRDLQEFLRHGLRPVQVTPVDMFPHTGHIEAVAILQR